MDSDKSLNEKKSMATKKSTPKTPSKKDKVLKAAESVIARKGFHDATISEIAKKANVSEATIYDHFSSKEGLLFSLPFGVLRQHQKENKKILKYVSGAANKLKILIYRHLELYAKNPEYATITVMILKNNKNFLKTEAYEIVKSSANIMSEVIEEGIQNGEFRSDLKPYLVRSMIWSTIDDLMRRKSMLGNPEDILQFVDDITNIIFRGIKSPSDESEYNITVTIEKNKE